MKRKMHNTTGTRISPDTDPNDLAKRIGVGPGEKLRNSSRRESYLQKVAGLVSLRDLVLYVRGQGAHVELNKDTPEINVTGDKHEQSVTDIPRDEYDLLVQEVLTMHECGHILFSDWPSFERYLNRVEMNDRHLFKNIWNAAEDGAIERQITSEFNVKDDFRVLYANLHEEQGRAAFGIEQESLQDTGGDETFYKFPMAHAVITAILDLWNEELYDEPSGALEFLLDEDNDEYVFGSPEDRETFVDFLPTIETYVEDMLTQSKARKRNKRTWEFWEDFQDLMDDAQVSGKRPLSDSGGGQNGMPDDAQPGIGDSSRDADDLESGEGGTVVIEVDFDDDGDEGGDEDDDEADGWGIGDDNDDGDEEDEEGDDGAGGDNEQDDDADEEGDGSDGEDGDDDEGESDQSDDGDDGGGDADKDGDDGEGGDDGDEDAEGSGGGDLKEAEERVERRYSREIDREAEEVGGDSMLDEAEEFLDILKGGNESGDMPDKDMKLVIPDGSDFNTDRFRQAKNDSRALKRLWEQKLQRQQRTRTEHGTRFGTPDSRSMHRSGRSTKVFKRRHTPDKKDYEAIVVLDRSSSMSGQLVRQAERAAGALLMSLHGVGVDVSMISLDSNEAVLELPFGGRVEDQKNVIFTESTGGSTPISQATYLARHRLNRHATTTRFMLVITDGRPDDSSAFAAQVNEANFPVLGIEIGGNSYGNPGYDRLTQVPKNGDILASLRNLVNEVMF
ncbi:cobalamin biosynthesis protein CobT [Haloarcula virus HCTV-16]|nr:cobalamin biosynthesis protein CobT [Haloarcula virus HCTV-16]